MRVNKKHILILTIIAIFPAILFTTCFTGYSGSTGTLVLTVGGTGNVRMAVGEKEPASLEHEAIISGPGGTTSYEFVGSSIEIPLPQGSYNITIRAVGATPDEYNTIPGKSNKEENPTFSAEMLRAYGWADEVKVIAGEYSTPTIKMETATEVSNYPQLKRAIDVAGEKPEIILIKSDIEISDDGIEAYCIPINGDKEITILTEEKVSIIRKGTKPFVLIVVYGGAKLTLGRNGMLGELIIDGNYTEARIIEVYSAKVVLNDSVIVQNTKDLAVHIDGFPEPKGTFTMNGGIITNNNKDGGGVQVDPNGIFNMYNGEISGNIVKTEGGGVKVNSGVFNMHGGFIKDNIAIINDGNPADGAIGGGVFVGGSGEFNMDGGTISGNKADVKGDSIYTAKGGGVYIDYGSKFSKTGGTIYGIDNKVLQNTAVEGEGDAVYAMGNAGGGISNKIKNKTVGTKDDLSTDSTEGWD